MQQKLTQRGVFNPKWFPRSKSYQTKRPTMLRWENSFDPRKHLSQSYPLSQSYRISLALVFPNGNYGKNQPNPSPSLHPFLLPLFSICFLYSHNWCKQTKHYFTSLQTGDPPEGSKNRRSNRRFSSWYCPTYRRPSGHCMTFCDVTCGDVETQNSEMGRYFFQGLPPTDWLNINSKRVTLLVNYHFLKHVSSKIPMFINAVPPQN